MFFKKNVIMFMYKLKGVIQIMLKNILIDGYENVFYDIILEYGNIIKKNNRYYKYLNIINYEIKEISVAFKKLLNKKQNTFKSIFKYKIENILYSIDKELFEHIEKIFENVSILLNTK